MACGVGWVCFDAVADVFGLVKEHEGMSVIVLLCCVVFVLCRGVPCDVVLSGVVCYFVA